MSDLINDAVEQFDGDVIEDLADVKEEKALKPACKNVPLFIESVEIDNADKSGKERNWKMLNVKFELPQGITVDGKTSYVGAKMNKRICYAIKKEAYDMTKPFFSKQQYLVELKQLISAVGGSLSGLTPSKAVEQLTGKLILGDIVQVKETIKDEEGLRVDTGNFINDLKYFKELPLEMRA